MSLTVDGVWKAGVWAFTAWADGVWREGPPSVPIASEVRPAGGYYFPEKSHRRIAEDLLLAEEEAEEASRKRERLEEEREEIEAKKEKATKRKLAALAKQEKKLLGLIALELERSALLERRIAFMRQQQNALLVLGMSMPFHQLRLA